MKRFLVFCLLGWATAQIVYSATFNLCMGNLPSTNVVSTIKIYYGPQMNSYTNYILYQPATWAMVTNAPFTGYNPEFCRNEEMKWYLKTPIPGLVGGQILYYKVTYVWKDGNEVTIHETKCASIVNKDSSTVTPPTNLRIVQ